MPRITYIESSGTRHELNVPVGWSVMDGAVKNGVPGIVAECGGSCACGTCHVYIDAPWYESLPSKEDNEATMLEFGEDMQPASRLSCQVEVTDDMDGLIVRIPASQR
jgi:ferredoxin, 2Fe-2S